MSLYPNVLRSKPFHIIGLFLELNNINSNYPISKVKSTRLARSSVYKIKNTFENHKFVNKNIFYVENHSQLPNVNKISIDCIHS